jgi:branched-chain amino acid transport system substrate-binding protein
MIAGRKVDIITRDTTGSAPDVAKRLAQELIVRDQADILIGYDYTANALAVSPLAAQAKIPVLNLMAPTDGIHDKFPNVVRISYTNSQLVSAIAKYAVDNHIHTASILVSDFAPGLNAAKTFRERFEAGGGKIVDEITAPFRNADFSPFAQRIKDAQPDAVFVYLPAGSDQQLIFLKAFADTGLTTDKIKILSEVGLASEMAIDAIGPTGLGVIAAVPYSDALDTPANKAFVGRYEAISGGKRPNFISAMSYDALAAIASVVEQQGGKFEPAKTIELLSHLTLTEGPRGDVVVDPATRDPLLTIYITRIVRDGEHYIAKPIAQFDHVPRTGVP